MRQKTIAIALAMVMVAAFFAAGCTSQNGQESALEKVVVSELRSEFWLPVYLAQELGYFEDEGLDVEFVTYKDGPVALMGMLAGDSDFCMLSLEPVLRVYDQGKESKVIMATLQNKPYMFASRAEIQQVSDLKGTVIFAGMPGSAPYLFVESILTEAGLDPAIDVTFANLEYGAAVAALSNGSVDAAYVSAIRKPDVLAIGGNILVDATDPAQHKRIYGSEKYESSIVVVNSEFATARPEVVQKFASAAVKAMAWLAEHSDEEVASTVGTLLPNLEPGYIGALRSSYSPDGYISKDGYATVVDFSLKTGIITEPIPYEQIIDMSFIKQ